jgi:hypothetical protein
MKKWYYKTSIVIIAFLTIGPLALPLVWFNPRFSQRTKIIVTILTVILTYYLAAAVIDSLKAIRSYYQQLFQQI